MFLATAFIPSNLTLVHVLALLAAMQAQAMEQGVSQSQFISDLIGRARLGQVDVVSAELHHLVNEMRKALRVQNRAAAEMTVLINDVIRQSEL